MRGAVMGLDMCVYAVREVPPSLVDFELPRVAFEQPLAPKYLHTWRKHWNLHRWMERLYREKGGASTNFNLVFMLLTKEDLDRLEADVKAGLFPAFWTTRPDADAIQAEIDMEFIAKARSALSAGLYLVYSASH